MAEQQLSFAWASDVGRQRTTNEDRVLFEPQRGLFAVIDGVGGEWGGEVAAEAAVEALRQRLRRRTASAQRRLREAITLANNSIFKQAQEDPNLEGMSCVLTAIIIEGNRVTIGHVGDTRLYLLEPGAIRKITRDHSPIGNREDRAEINELEAMQHPRRNEILRDVGSELHEPDDDEFIDTSEIELPKHGAMLLCSDGLTDHLTAEQLREVVQTRRADPQAAVDELIVRANAAGGKDNITAMLIAGPGFADAQQTTDRVGTESGKRPGPPRRRGWLLLLLGIFLGCLLVISVDLSGFGVSISRFIDPGSWGHRTDREVHRTVGPGDAEFRTISAALAAAHSGEVIEVAPGTYRESVRLRDGVELVAKVRRAALLQSPRSGSAVAVVSAQGVRQARVGGFRIECGARKGLLLADSIVTAEDLEIFGGENTAVQISGSDRSTLQACYVHDNAGSGILITDQASPRLRHNLVRNNGTGLKRSPGIEIRSLASPLILANKLEYNAGGGVATVHGESVTEILGWNFFNPRDPAKKVLIVPFRDERFLESE